jgi:ubiquinone/menaquinone biosynthesis C-methylase UbiE
MGARVSTSAETTTCSRATGETLEVAVGTGLNLGHYPRDVSLTGIDLSPDMLGIAYERASTLERKADLKQADAHELPFADESFDTVVCTYSLCNIPDPRRAVAEMKRVLRPSGRLILVDHIRSAVRPIFWFQKGIEFFTHRLEGEYMTRRPLEQVNAEGFDVLERERMRAGVVERLVAVKAEE